MRERLIITMICRMYSNAAALISTSRLGAYRRGYRCAAWILWGRGDILLLFFLQAKLPESGIPNALLGMALFIMELGGILGARVILLCDRLRYRTVFVLTGFLVLLGIAVEHSGNYVIMTLGGFIAAFSDDALQVRTNTILQNMFPSEQRATLISMESFTFSMIMIVLSPLTGILFSWW